MHRKLSQALLAAATAPFAFDVYLPLEPRTLETDLGYEIGFGIGGYDADGAFQDAGDASPMTQAPSVQVKYGILPGLDVEAAASLELRNEDANEGTAVSGLSQPELALKYVHPELGLGGFVNVAFPVGSEDIVGDEPATGITLGVIGGKTFGQIAVNAYAGYVYTTEVESWKQDELTTYAQAQYNLSEMVGPYLGLAWDKGLEGTWDGDARPESVWWILTANPGANFVFNDRLSAEASVPVTLAGNNVDASWGLFAGVYYTLGL